MEDGRMGGWTFKKYFSEKRTARMIKMFLLRFPSVPVAVLWSVPFGVALVKYVKKQSS